MAVRCAHTDPEWQPLVIDRKTWDSWDGAETNIFALFTRTGGPMGPHSAKIDEDHKTGYHAWMKLWPSTLVQPNPGSLPVADPLPVQTGSRSERSPCTIL
jgi:hypothetical protein